MHRDRWGRPVRAPRRGCIGGAGRPRSSAPARRPAMGPRVRRRRCPGAPRCSQRPGHRSWAAERGRDRHGRRTGISAAGRRVSKPHGARPGSAGGRRPGGPVRPLPQPRSLPRLGRAATGFSTWHPARRRKPGPAPSTSPSPATTQWPPAAVSTPTASPFWRSPTTTTTALLHGHRGPRLLRDRPTHRRLSRLRRRQLPSGRPHNADSRMTPAARWTRATDRFRPLSGVRACPVPGRSRSSPPAIAMVAPSWRHMRLPPAEASCLG